SPVGSFRFRAPGAAEVSGADRRRRAAPAPSPELEDRADATAVAEIVEAGTGLGERAWSHVPTEPMIPAASWPGATRNGDTGDGASMLRRPRHGQPAPAERQMRCGARGLAVPGPW